MSDNLRTRIIAALRTTKTGRTEFHSYQLDDVADAVIRELDDDFVDFGLWLAQEITGRSMTRIDLESCLADWKAGSDD